MEALEVANGEYYLTTDKNKMDVAAIHEFLCYHSDWSKGIPLERVQTSIEHSLNFGIFHFGKQIAFARVISDYATIAYLGDVYVLDAYRGKGISKMLMDAVMIHPQLQGLRRWILLTTTAEWLYTKYGFRHVANPDAYMELHQPGIYLAK